MTQPQRVALIANPVARHGTALSMAKICEEMLRAHNLNTHTFVTTSTESVQELTQHIVDQESFSTLMVVAGDGTIHEVGNALLRNDREHRPVLAVVPAGSGNDFARTLGVAKSLEDAVSAVVQGRVEAMDVARANDEFYLETFSFGIDAETAYEANKLARKSSRTGKALYLPALIKARATYKHQSSVIISLEDGEPRKLEPMLCAVNNGKTYGGGMALTYKANIFDGYLDVAMVSHIPFIRFLYGIIQVIKGTVESKFPELEYGHYRSVVIETVDKTPIRYQIDGEIRESAKINIEVIPRELDVVYFSETQPNLKQP